MNANPDDSKGRLEEGFHKTSDHPTISRRDRSGHLLSSVALMRPDAVVVWEDPEVRRRFSWYQHVMTGEFPAKFILCRKIPATLSLEEIQRAYAYARALNLQFEQVS